MIFYLLVVFVLTTLANSFRVIRLSNQLKFHTKYDAFSTFVSLDAKKIKATTSASLHMSSYDDDKPALSFKTIAIAFVGLAGVFGLGFISTLQTTVKDFAQSSQAPSSTLKNTSGERGAMTKLTKREINSKLAQIPVFYAIDPSGGILTKDGTGYIFFAAKDAEIYAKKYSTKISATSLDNVYYTLIEKRTKLAVVEDPIAKSDPTATYIFSPASSEIGNIPPDWKASHPAIDVPLFRVPKMAFSKEEGLELPLFLRKQDALLAFERLQDTKKEKGVPTESSEPNLQVTSLLDIIGLFSTGGFEGRALEFYPSMDEVTDAKQMMGAK